MMETYIKALLAQIRCQKAHPMIEEEIRTHIKEQMLENEQSGMDKENAEINAVYDMGDPIAVGTSLDHIHRPSISVSLLILMAILTILGNVIHFFVLADATEKWSFLRISLVGYFLMCGTYFLDYTFFAKYAKKIGVALLMFVFFVQFSNIAISINGARRYVPFGPFQISLMQWMLLYVPCYSAILYHYRNTKISGVIKAFLFALIPTYLVLHMSGTIYAMIMFFTMSMLLTISVYKGWFLIPKKKFYIIYWGGGLLAIVATLYHIMSLHGYQEARLSVLLHRREGVNYVSTLLASLQKGSNLFGESGQVTNQVLPEGGKVYILTNLMVHIGIIPGVLLCLLFVLFYVKLFRMAIAQKNELGMLITISCIMLLVLEFLLNIAMNALNVPVMATYLPFVSAGNQSLLVSYVLIGIILSTYKYKSVLPKQIEIKKRKVKVLA